MPSCGVELESMAGSSVVKLRFSHGFYLGHAANGFIKGGELERVIGGCPEEPCFDFVAGFFQCLAGVFGFFDPQSEAVLPIDAEYLKLRIFVGLVPQFLSVEGLQELDESFDFPEVLTDFFDGH